MTDEEKLVSLEREKEQRIRSYMALQDQADALNERIYKVCLGVEALNAQIGALREQIRKAALKAPPANGKHHPPPAV
jgi:hypothetical protein